MEQESAEGQYIFFPSLKQGVNEALRASFARAGLTNLEERVNDSTIPVLKVNGTPFPGLNEIRCYLEFCESCDKH